MSQSKIAAAIQ